MGGDLGKSSVFICPKEPPRRERTRKRRVWGALGKSICVCVYVCVCVCVCVCIGGGYLGKSSVFICPKEPPGRVRTCDATHNYSFVTSRSLHCSFILWGERDTQTHQPKHPNRHRHTKHPETQRRRGGGGC